MEITCELLKQDDGRVVVSGPWMDFVGREAVAHPRLILQRHTTTPVVGDTVVMDDRDRYVAPEFRDCGMIASVEYVREYRQGSNAPGGARRHADPDSVYSYYLIATLKVAWPENHPLQPRA